MKKFAARGGARFSMLESEWPARKAAFEQWLSVDNFDETGARKASLAGLSKNPDS